MLHLNLIRHMGYGYGIWDIACDLYIDIEITVFLGRKYGLNLHADCGHYIDQIWLFNI